MTIDTALAEKLERCLDDNYWRINNLYQIVNKYGEKVTFKLNWAQEQLFRTADYCNIILKARQLGISTYICLLFLDRCLFNSNVSAGIIAHTREDAEFMFKRIKFAYDLLPPEIKEHRTATVDSARELVFNNGSSLRVGTSMRGATFQYLHISEFGKICAHYPEKAREVITGSLNTLASGQYCFIESTAEGREGPFYEMCKKSQDMQESKKPLTPLDFKFYFFPWHKAPEYVVDDEVPIPQELVAYFKSLDEQGIKLTLPQKQWYVKKIAVQADDMKREFPSTPQEAFLTAAEGVYYQKQLGLARMEGRVGKVLWDAELPVHCSFDLGFGDSTAIWWFQVVGNCIHLIEYYENSNEPLTFYLKLIKEKKYTYGKFIVPHDAAVHDLGNGLTRIETARKHGITFTLAADISLEEGIDACRNLLNRCYFDEERCSLGIKHMEAYKRAWNDTHGCWTSKPVHNQASHCADSFRMLAVSLNKLNVAGMSDAEVERLANIYQPRFAANY